MQRMFEFHAVLAAGKFRSEQYKYSSLLVHVVKQRLNT